MNRTFGSEIVLLLVNFPETIDDALADDRANISVDQIQNKSPFVTQMLIDEIVSFFAVLSVDFLRLKSSADEFVS